ncbi:MAG TPA: class I SAM-dependent methyltransferase [Sumerlaeia bacterium]|nr:class I SAM-dependent methyltransferase [Sumerlaeia bacterium]
MTRPWYETAFGPHYTDLYSHRDEACARRAVDFLLRRDDHDPSDGRVLDLCCGAGRHGFEWIRRTRAGLIGVDLSPHLLAGASRKRRRLAPRLLLARADMRHLPFRDRTFRLVLNLFTSFGYFMSEGENERVFAEVARVLEKPGGRFVLDHINPSWLRANLEPETVRTTRRGARVRERRTIDPQTRRVEKRIEIAWEDGRTSEALESVRLYEPGEIEAMASRHGFDVETAFGDYDDSPLDERSPRAIYILRT